MPGTSARPVLSLVGGAIGGAIGSVLTALLADRGLYALVLPGALLGAGCGAMSVARSRARGIVCGVAGLVLGLLVDWWVAPFPNDKSFVYFLTNIHRGTLMLSVMVVLGALAAYWFGGDTFSGWRRPSKPAGVDDRPRVG